MLRDRDGALWIGTFDRGLIRVHQDRVDLFSRADGLSSNYVRGLFEDREGNIWVATDNGLDRFRHTAVTTISANHGLSEGTPWSVLPASDGSVWVGTLSGLNRLTGRTDHAVPQGGTTAPARSRRTGPARGDRRRVAARPDPVALRGPPAANLGLDTPRRRRLRARPLQPGRRAFHGCAGIRRRCRGQHLGQRGDDADACRRSDESSSGFRGRACGSRVPAGAMLSDPVGGGLWLGFRDGTGVAYVKGGRVVVSYRPRPMGWAGGWWRSAPR